MKTIELKTKQNLFDELGITLEQLHISLDDQYYLRINGSASLHEKSMCGYELYIKANLCNADGNILYVLSNYDGIKFDLVNYDAFSIVYNNISILFPVEELCYVELYPNVRPLS